MTQYVFGFVMYGIPSPWVPDAPNTVLYTDNVLPVDGRPTELVGAEVRARVFGRPGLNWGADPRSPVGSGEEVTVQLLDDALGTMGTLFLEDSDSETWGLNTNRLSPTGDAVSVTKAAIPSDGNLHYINNECVQVGVNSTTTGIPPTHSLTLSRGLCGSVARVHVVRPSEYSEGESGVADRIELSRKPNFGRGFYCGLYLFKLDEFGAIESYLLRRGVVSGYPEDAFPFYNFKVKFLEDKFTEHKLGHSVETALLFRIQVTQYVAPLPKAVLFWLQPLQAEKYFNEPLRLRGNPTLNAAAVANLNARLKKDPKITYQVVLNLDGIWVFKINSLDIHNYTQANNGGTQQVLRLSCSLEQDGAANGASILDTQANGSALRFKPWWENRTSSIYTDGFRTGDAPKITLRLKMVKNVIRAFRCLAVSEDASTTSADDAIIGGVGVGLPAAYLSTGAAAANTAAGIMGIPTNTSILEQLEQILAPVNTYYFDLSKGGSLKDFLANEFIATQLLLGSLQSGLLALKSWVHEVAATVTLNPIASKLTKGGQRLKPIKRLDLAAGVRVLDLEPVERRSVRYLGTSNIKTEEVQPIRFWRDGVNLTVENIATGDLSQLIRVFYKLLGGAPKVYEVACTVEDHLTNGVEFGDAVNWSCDYIPTPSGLGISAQFFVVGIDLDFDEGICNYKLLQNTLYSAPAPISQGQIAPALTVTAATVTFANQVDVKVSRSDGAELNPDTDFGGLYAQIQNTQSPIKLHNFGQAPIGEKEKGGAVEAHVFLDAYAKDPITKEVTFTLIITSTELRGSYTTEASHFVAGETKLVLPDRIAEESSRSGNEIAADPYAGANRNNYLSYQPKNSQLGVVHTFGT